jgi:hypothetical protein
MTQGYFFEKIFFTRDHLAVVPEGGYMRQDKQSKLALKFLKWYEHKNGSRYSASRFTLQVKKRNKKLRFDGFIDRGTDQKGLVIEVLSCAFRYY